MVKRALRLALPAVLTVVAAVSTAATSGASPRTAAATTTPIRHVVVLMQENHTFDSELGGWCTQNAGRCPAGGIPATVTLASGKTVTPSAAPDAVPLLVHTVNAQAAAIDGGKMDGWARVGGCHATDSPPYACISYYPASAVPNLAALASAYGVEDRAFTGADSPSWGGHLELAAASTDGFTGDKPASTTGPGWGIDSKGLASWQPSPGAPLQNIPSCIPDFTLGTNGGCFEATPAAHIPTIMDELATAGDSWAMYSPQPGQPGYQWATCPSFADCYYNQSGHVFTDGQFFTAAQAGTLPAVSFIIPPENMSQHNLQSNAVGDNWIGQVAAAVMSSPDWPSAALIITYDDCGCFYDQVPPPLAPDGRQEGPRVPFVVVSPYAKPGYTDDTQTSSTGSILAFIEFTFGLPALNTNDAAAYNLSGMFNFTPGAARLKGPQMIRRHLPASAYRVNPAAANDGT